MTAQVVFFNDFTEKDLHVNAVEGMINNKIDLLHGTVNMNQKNIFSLSHVFFRIGLEFRKLLFSEVTNIEQGTNVLKTFRYH